MARPKKSNDMDKKAPKNKENITISAVDDQSPDGYIAEICQRIGENIRKERKLRRFSIEDLAEFSELSTSFIGLLERGERCPSLKSLIKLCELFGKTPDELIYDKKRTTKIKVAEEKQNLYQNKRDTLNTIIQRFSDSELDYAIVVLKNLKLMNNKMNVEKDRSYLYQSGQDDLENMDEDF